MISNIAERATSKRSVWELHSKIKNRMLLEIIIILRDPSRDSYHASSKEWSLVEQRGENQEAALVSFSLS